MGLRRLFDRCPVAVLKSSVFFLDYRLNGHHSSGVCISTFAIGFIGCSLRMVAAV